MQVLSVRSARALVALAGAFVVAACSESTSANTRTNGFVVSKLVADVSGLGAVALDANLKNAWGIAFGPASTVWVSDNHSGMATVYSPSGTKLSTSVSILASGGSPVGAPTGVVLNNTSDFNIGLTGGPATFIFAGEDGTLSAWNANAGGTAVIVADRSATGAVYKGITMAATGGANFLYATDFHNNRVDVYDGSFARVSSFTDATLPAGYAPFGIQNIGGRLYVTFAKQLPPDNTDDLKGAGNGYVDIFMADGTFVTRFASNGKLNSPWGIAIAPTAFGGFAGTVLIGNFGDGRIGAYDATTGTFIDYLRDKSGSVITLNGLWALQFGPASGSTTMYFSAGPNTENDGLMGTITPQ